MTGELMTEKGGENENGGEEEGGEEGEEEITLLDGLRFSHRRGVRTRMAAKKKAAKKAKKR